MQVNISEIISILTIGELPVLDSQRDVIPSLVSCLTLGYDGTNISKAIALKATIRSLDRLKIQFKPYQELCSGYLEAHRKEIVNVSSNLVLGLSQPLWLSNPILAGEIRLVEPTKSLLQESERAVKPLLKLLISRLSCMTAAEWERIATYRLAQMEVSEHMSTRQALMSWALSEVGNYAILEHPEVVTSGKPAEIAWRTLWGETLV